MTFPDNWRSCNIRWIFSTCPSMVAGIYSEKRLIIQCSTFISEIVCKYLDNCKYFTPSKLSSSSQLQKTITSKLDNWFMYRAISITHVSEPPTPVVSIFLPVHFVNPPSATIQNIGLPNFCGMDFTGGILINNSYILYQSSIKL